ncbi:MAG TPA: YetF domain-containing protein [Usitatibacter sp.]|jgi:uncharacterized membrane protein YcaP (DUF421 family)|nr:YetF domain-containing protein [Usitatibacter sp.]
MASVDWSELFIPSGSLVEIVIRGTVMYLLLFAAMRILPRRQVGGLVNADLLIVVLIADAVQNAMAGGYRSITEGVALAAVIFGWATVIDWLDFKFPRLNLASARALPVVRNGRFLRRNMAREQVSEEEIMAELRQHGLDSMERVASAYIEGDGRFSVLLRGGSKPPVDPPQERRGV